LHQNCANGPSREALLTWLPGVSQRARDVSGRRSVSEMRGRELSQQNKNANRKIGVPWHVAQSCLQTELA